ncbi:MAG: C40 family peptidase [Pseudomonadota bacterium]
MVELNDKRIARPGEGDSVPAVVARPNSPLLTTKDGAAQRVSSAVFGESVEVFAKEGDFGLVRHGHDHYVGWSKLADLGAAPEQAFTHWVSSAMTHAFSKPDLKSAPKTALFLGSRLIISEVDGAYHFMDGIGWLHEAQILPMDQVYSDPSGVALGFLGSPYLWGGRDAFGLDCSGLTQQAFAACGIRLPRDSDMQFAWSGVALENWAESGALQRGDLIFWRGHVGMMLDDVTLLHANAYTMRVSTEPLQTAIERIDQHTPYGRPIGAKRIDLDRTGEPDWFAE